MKTIKLFSIALTAALSVLFASSCVNDLNVTPIDENTVLPEDVLQDQAAYNQLLAKIYQGLCCSGSYGQDSDPDMDGVDGGYGQYMRAIVNLQEVTTDVCICCWNDGNLYDLHNLCWNSSNEFVLSMYYRIFLQVSRCNEFIRRADASGISNFTKKDNYIAEARAMRLYSYYNAIDMFANVPFSDETSSVGSEGGKQIMRADLFDWMVREAEDLLSGNGLAEAGQAEYGRCDKGFVQMILAKLYLNAEIWKGEAMYDKCAELCEKIIAEYPLHENYRDLFCADNHLWVKSSTYGGDEIVFAAPQDGISLKSYGSTNFLVFACTFSTMDGSAMGISSGWSGLSLTGSLTSKFADGDARALFVKEGTDPDSGEPVVYNQYVDAARNAAGSSEGWKSVKFTNVNHDGSAAQDKGFVDTDFPVFRSADAYLMYAECAARGAADKTKGQKYLNAVSNRAGAGDLTLSLDNVLDERARELYLEGHRRQDLVRYGKFTTGDYLWDCKGGVENGTAVDSHFNIFPLISGDLNANANLTQNPGY